MKVKYTIDFDVVKDFNPIQIKKAYTLADGYHVVAIDVPVSVDWEMLWSMLNQLAGAKGSGIKRKVISE